MTVTFKGSPSQPELLRKLNQLSALVGSGGGSGTVTNITGAGTVSGLTLTGTVTTTGSLTLGGTLAVTTADIANGAVTLGKQADMATASVVYRKTAGAGAPEIQTLATLKTDLGLTGTNSGDQTGIVGITGTKAQFDTAVTDGNFLYVGDITQYTDELAQDAVGVMVDGSLTYVDATPLLQRAALTGAITASAGSNTTALGSFTLSQLNTALSDADVATGGGTATGTNTGDQNLAPYAPLLNPAFTGYLDFADIASPASPGAGVLRLWSLSAGGFDQLHFKDDAGLDYQIARDNIHTVRNISGGTLTKGTWVYITGSNGVFPTIAAARANSATTTPTAGILTANIANNAFGHMMTQGDVQGVDTSAFVDGDVLYLSAASAGLATTTAPTGTNIVQRVGVVVKSSAGAGIVAILIGGEFNPGLTQTLSNKTLVAPVLGTPASGTLTNCTGLPNAGLVNSTITIAGTSTALGGTITQDTITGLATTGIVKRTAANTLAIAVSATDYAPATSGSAILKGNGSGGFSSAASGTDYAPATSGTALLKGNGSGGFSAASAGTDYVAPDTQLTDLAALVYTANGGKFIRVNAGATAFELATVSGTGDVVGDDTSTTVQNIVAYSTTGGKNVTELTGTQGDVLYHNGTNWAKLGAGTLGQYLITNGSGANPAWGYGAVIHSSKSAGATTTGANTTPVSVTGAVFSYVASAVYKILVIGRVNSTAATTGIGLHFDLSSAVTAIDVNSMHQLAAGVAGTLTGGYSISDDASEGVSSGVPAGPLDVPITVNALLVTGANAGTCQLRVRSETTAVTEMMAGTVMVVQRVA